MQKNENESYVRRGRGCSRNLMYPYIEGGGGSKSTQIFVTYLINGPKQPQQNNSW